MKRKKIKVWKSQIKTLMRAMQFSALDADTQNCVNNEMLFFNTRRLAAISWVVLVLEALNMANVLFLSPSKLATANNQQYFTMYLLLFVSGVVCLTVSRLLRKNPKLWQKWCIGFTLYWILWHAQLSAMDLRRNPNIIVFITGMFAMSLLVRLKPRETICILPSGLLLLVFCARNIIPSGIAINAAIVTVVAMLISCSRYFSTLEELGYRKKMIVQANHRMDERQKLHLLLTQRGALLQYSCELMFLWEKEENTLTLSSDKSLCSTDKEALLAWIAKGDGNPVALTLCMEGEERPCEYQIEGMIQLDGDNIPIGAVGKMTHTECTGNCNKLKDEGVF